MCIEKTIFFIQRISCKKYPELCREIVGFLGDILVVLYTS